MGWPREVTRIRAMEEAPAANDQHSLRDYVTRHRHSMGLVCCTKAANICWAVLMMELSLQIGEGRRGEVIRLRPPLRTSLKLST